MKNLKPTHKCQRNGLLYAQYDGRWYYFDGDSGETYESFDISSGIASVADLTPLPGVEEQDALRAILRACEKSEEELKALGLSRVQMIQAIAKDALGEPKVTLC
jgi:hypothetical protein